MRLAVDGPGLSEPGAPYSPAIIAGGFVFVSGQASIDPMTHEVFGNDIVSQTNGTVRNLEKVLNAAGCSLNDVVKINAYLADIGDFERFSRAYSRLFAEPRPARTTVGAALTGILVEIDCIARLPDSKGSK
ncbi:MAG: RidA family protein [Hyphomicrobiaceae bacterium]|nr:RidA family protein [Hyphomicrobiaceae bacterium]